MGTGTLCPSPTVRVERVMICLSRGKHVTGSPQTVGKASPWPLGGASVWFMAQKQEKHSLLSAVVWGSHKNRLAGIPGFVWTRGSVDFVEYVQATWRKSWEDQGVTIKEDFRQKLEMPMSRGKSHKYWPDLQQTCILLCQGHRKKGSLHVLGGFVGIKWKNRKIFGRAEKETKEQLQEGKNQLYTVKPKECKANLSQD